MEHAIILILLVLSTICFFIAALNVASRINLIAFGLFFWVLTVLIPQLK